MKLALAAVRDLKPAGVKTACHSRPGPTNRFLRARKRELIILPWDLEVIVNAKSS